jgi:hypothetical protein
VLNAASCFLSNGAQRAAVFGRERARPFSDKIGDNTGVTFGTPLTVVNEKLDRINRRAGSRAIQRRRREEMSGHVRQRGKKGQWYAVIDVSEGGKRKRRWLKLEQIPVEFTYNLRA